MKLAYVLDVDTTDIDLADRVHNAMLQAVAGVVEAHHPTVEHAKTIWAADEAALKHAMAS